MFTKVNAAFDVVSGKAKTSPTGVIEYTHKGVVHNPCGPAQVLEGEYEHWMVHGTYHRYHGPAKICRLQNNMIVRTWMVAGKTHNEEGPAYVTTNVDNTPEYVEWKLVNRCHNEDGPASIFVREFATTYSYEQNGEMHRVDGPARYAIDNNDNVVQEQWARCGQLHNSSGPAFIDHEEGIEEYCLGGYSVDRALVDNFDYDVNYDDAGTKIYTIAGGPPYPHREDGPAKIHSDGTQEWMQCGRHHREDGPAIISGDQSIQKYYRCDSLHNLDGPAVISPDVTEWRVCGSLHRIDGPARICGESQYWFVCGVPHRDDDQPASIIAPGDSTRVTVYHSDKTSVPSSIVIEGPAVVYWKFGHVHRDREYGPAIIMYTKTGRIKHQYIVEYDSVIKIY